MSVFLRITAGLSLCWAVTLLVFTPAALAHLAEERLAVSLAGGLAVAHVGLAFAFWRGARNPSAERTAIYTALLVLGLRGAKSTYETLYVLEGTPAVLSLIEMVTCIALFVAILNALPGTLRPGSTGEACENTPDIGGRTS